MACSGGGVHYQQYFYDRYPPVQCPDNFFRPEMCNALANGFGCGIYPPPPPPATFMPPVGETGDLPTPQRPMTPTIVYPGYAMQSGGVQTGMMTPGGGPHGMTGGDVGCALAGMGNTIDYYNAWTAIRARKNYQCPHVMVPDMNCTPWWAPDRGLLADGPVTTRPPDAYPVEDAQNDVDQAQNDLDQALEAGAAAQAAGDRDGVNAASRAAQEATNALENAKVRLGFALLAERRRLAEEQAAQGQQAAQELAPKQETTKSNGGIYAALLAAAGLVTVAYAYRDELGLTKR